MFTRLDKSGDRRLTLAEFTQALPTLEKWGICIPDTQAAFKEIDTNGGGFVLFDEFVGWAMMKNLDLEDDDDYNANLAQESTNNTKQSSSSKKEKSREVNTKSTSDLNSN